MRATGSRRPDPLDLAWLAFALVNVAAMLLWPSWETIPFHLIWFSLTLLYGFRVWALKPTYVVLTVQGLVTGLLIASDAARCRRACQTIARNIADMSGTSNSSPHSCVPLLASEAIRSPVTRPCTVRTT